MADLADKIAAQACSESDKSGGIFMASPYDCARRAAKIALEEAAKIADAKSQEATTEAKALRGIKDYARAKQLELESAACAEIAVAIRALSNTTPPGADHE